MAESWSRLEIGIRRERRLADGTSAPDLEVGLEARVADPLWMLARQWQVGELRGEDAGSPVGVDVEVGYTQPVQIETGGVSAPIGAGLDVLEAVVEPERPEDGPARFRLAAEAGLHFLRLLDAAGAGQARQAFRGVYALVPPAAGPLDTPGLRRRIALLARTSIDGTRLAAALRAQPTTAVPSAVPVGLGPAIATATGAFLRWMDRRVHSAPATQTAWQPSRLEHRVSLTAPGPQGPIVLRAEDYGGGSLEWWSFDRDPAARSTPPPRALAKPPGPPARLLPTPVRYRGMPAARWWELEDGRVHLGGLSAGPAEPARLLVAEFGTVFGDNWYLVPVTVPAGSLCRITRLTVTDSFGGTTPLRSTAEVDGPGRKWRFFELTGDGSVDDKLAPWLLVAPTAAPLEGPAVEKLAVVRDEGANLAWGIERTVESPLGTPVDRDLGGRRATPERRHAGKARRYMLESLVPPNWIPLVPVVRAGRRQYEFRRGRMSQWATLPTTAAPGVRGTLMGAPGQVVREEEVPASGLVVTRRWQLARGSDGRIVLWMGRRKAPGAGTARSGLRYDLIES